MRRLIPVGLAVALFLAVVPLALSLLQGPSRSQGAAASSTLACSVKTSCGAVGEVAVFRMWDVVNAHAQTADGTTYDNIVCCSGPAGLSAACNGHDATVLRLWATDNAHAAQASDTNYTTKVCLSSDTGMNCKYGSSCGSGYACLATISSATNAHVADCDGSGDYATKVCCAAQAAPAVGGVAELPSVAPEGAGEPQGSSGPNSIALAAAAAGGVILLAGGAWYARRRWLR